MRPAKAIELAEALASAHSLRPPCTMGSVRAAAQAMGLAHVSRSAQATRSAKAMRSAGRQEPEQPRASAPAVHKEHGGSRTGLYVAQSDDNDTHTHTRIAFGFLRPTIVWATRIRCVLANFAPAPKASFRQRTMSQLMIVIRFAKIRTACASSQPSSGHAGDGIITVFYVALLHMLRHLQSPFDDFASPNDALSPVALLNHTERKLRDYLSAPDPDDILEGFDGQAPAISFRGAPAAPPAFRPGRRPSL